MGHRFGRFDRRALLAGATSLSVAAAIGRIVRADEDALQLLCWSGYDNGDATKGFRDRAGLDVRATIIGSNDEIFAYLRAGGIGKFDVVTPSNGVVGYLASAGLIQPLDAARLPNLAGVMSRFRDADWTTQDGQLYAVPLTWHTAPIVFNSDNLPDPPSRWLDLDDDRFTDRLVMHDDAIGHLVTCNRALGAADPMRVTRDELSASVKRLGAIKNARAHSFVTGLVEVADEIVSSRAVASLTGAESILGNHGAGGLGLAHPEPGDFSICDALCIPAGAPRLDAAYAFIDHMLSVEAQAAFATATHQGTVAEAAMALLPDEVRAIFAYDDLDAVFGLSPLVGYPPIEADGTDTATWVDWVLAWDRVRVTATFPQNEPTPAAAPEATTPDAAPPT